MTETPPRTPPRQVEPAAPGKTSGMAIASVVLGTLGFCTFGLTGLVGLVLGIVALMQGRSGPPGETRRSGVAISGLIVSILSLLTAPVLAIMTGLLLPALGKARVNAELAMAQAQLRQVAIATEAYAADWDGHLPPADEWVDLLGDGYLAQPGMVVAWPRDEASGRAFAMNERLGGTALADLDDPAAVVLFFEAAPGSPPAGGPELLPAAPRHSGGYVIVFADGHSEIWPAEEIDGLEW